MATCILCTHIIDIEDAKMDYECGCHTVHSACGFARIYTSVMLSGRYKCETCKTVLCPIRGQKEEQNLDQEQNQEQEQNQNQEENQEQKDELFITTMKKVKNACKMAKKSLNIYRRVLGASNTLFRERIRMNITSIRMAQQETMETLKKTPEFRQSRTNHNRMYRAITAFQNTYDLSNQQLKDYNIPSPNHYFRWRHQPTKLMKYKFRVLLR